MNPLPSPEGGAGTGARGLLPSLQVGQRLQDIPPQQYSHRNMSCGTVYSRGKTTWYPTNG
jgi:hypothetical protein